MGLSKLFGLQRKGHIETRLTKDHYLAGELVEGTIHVVVHEPIQCHCTYDRFQ